MLPKIGHTWTWKKLSETYSCSSDLYRQVHLKVRESIVHLVFLQAPSYSTWICLIYNIGESLMQKTQSWTHLLILITQQPESSCFFPFWNRGNIVSNCRGNNIVSIELLRKLASKFTTIVSKLVASVAKLLTQTNCQSKYQHCMTTFQNPVWL